MKKIARESTALTSNVNIALASGLAVELGTVLFVSLSSRSVTLELD